MSKQCSSQGTKSVAALLKLTILIVQYCTTLYKSNLINICNTMPNYKGNPDFGTKYRFDNGRDKPLSEQVKTAILPETKLLLKDLASKKNCTVPDLVRAAIEEYLANSQSNIA